MTKTLFIARQYAQTTRYCLTTSVRPSVHLSIRLPNAGTVSKRMYISEGRFWRHTVFDTKIYSYYH